MTTPALFYSFLLASLYGASFHFWKGGRGGKLFLSLFLSWIGFGAGHTLAVYLESSLLMIGPIHVGFGSLGSLVMIFLGHWSSRRLEAA